MDQVIKVTFPAFSRLQDDKEELSKAVSKSILYICLLVFPSLVMLILLAPSLVEIIPRYYKWREALFALGLLAANSALAAITTPLTNTLNAIGKISVTFKLMIMWTALTWLFVPILSINLGINGAALGFALVGFSSFIAMIYAAKFVKIDYIQVVGRPLLVSAAVLVIAYIIKVLIPVSVLQISSMIVGGLTSFIISVILLEPQILNYLKIKK